MIPSIYTPGEILGNKGLMYLREYSMGRLGGQIG